jgi:hypothetical protein
MTLEDKIAALLLEAAPLRCLPEMEQGELGAIVDQINRLRALQAAVGDALGIAIDQKHEAELQAVMDEVNPPKRGPGRPKKAAP